MRRYDFFYVTLKTLIFALMVFIYIQTINAGKRADVPYRITLKNEALSEASISFNFRPEISISKRCYDTHRLDRLELLSAPAFCDIADELIDLFRNQPLVFSEALQFRLLKSQFKTIGYNFDIRPRFLFHPNEKSPEHPISALLEQNSNLHEQSVAYAKDYVMLMSRYIHEPALKNVDGPESHTATSPDLSHYKMAPGVYYFLDEKEAIVYVGKAKNIRKRLQSHFTQGSAQNHIDYASINAVHVDYTGNDILAQLIESAEIKKLKPIYNTQQIIDPAPYIINKAKTAKGIHKLQITRKEIKDNMPERYFNRGSVKHSLEQFCSEYGLCRKHCGLETIKGPCSNVTIKHQQCVCADPKLINAYNERFETAFEHFKNKKSRKIYKLKGRHNQEDAFIYTVNDIYEGYGFIDKNEPIYTPNDILGHLIAQHNNYDTSRILDGLKKQVPKDDILILSER